MLFKVANVITGAGSDSAKQDEGASLTSVLETPLLRVELALLILLCTDAMRSDLIATFDADKTHETVSSTAPPPSPKPKTTTNDLISFDEPVDEEATATERARAARQREVESTQIQGLKRSALTFFDKWRAGVMHRICDVLCVRGEVVRQAKAKRKQMMDEADRQKQGNSLLIDFEGDPFGNQPQKGYGKRKHGHYDIIESQLLRFEQPKRVLILHCLLLLLLSLEHYPAHSRVLLLRLSSSLELEATLLSEHEKSVAQGLLATAASQMDAEEAAKKQASNDAASRKWKVGLAAVGGAVLIGVTGGLAAPLLAAGIGTVMGGLGLGVVSTYLGALAGSSVLVGTLFGAYGAKMTGNIMKQYAREVQDFEFIPVQDPERPAAQRNQEWSEEQDARDPAKREQHRLRVSIGISGWLNSPADVNKPWEIIDASGTEPFALRFELDAMLRMGNSLHDVLFSYAWDGVTYTVVSQTILGALYAGLWPLGLVKVASVLDNPFSVAMARADKAGKVLAHALIDGVQGKRPVTLIGYSIGARVIYSCLVELAEQHAFGLVESVALMGAPIPSDSKSWRQVRSVVAARVVNVYSTEDYILGFLYRSTKLQMGVAGLQEVKDVYGVENVNMSKLVSGHDRYRFLVGTILTKINFGDIELNKVTDQERALELEERKKQQVREHVKKHQKDAQKPDPAATGAMEMIVVQNNKPAGNLIDMSDLSTGRVGTVLERLPMTDSEAAPRPRPARGSRSAPGPQAFQRSLTMQNRSGQQPSIQRQMTMPSFTSTNIQAGPKPAEPLSDPLGATEVPSPTESSPQRTAKFDFAPASQQRQIPSNMSPIPTAEPQQNNPARSQASSSGSSGSSEDQQTVMRDLESQKVSPPLEEMLKTPKGVAPTIAVTAAQADESDEGEDSDDVDSQFGDLSMVEPVPLDDNDHGLM